jgi:hypothetical protein
MRDLTYLAKAQEFENDRLIPPSRHLHVFLESHFVLQGFFKQCRVPMVFVYTTFASLTERVGLVVYHRVLVDIERLDISHL